MTIVSVGSVTVAGRMKVIQSCTRGGSARNRPAPPFPSRTYIVIAVAIAILEGFDGGLDVLFNQILLIRSSFGCPWFPLAGSIGWPAPSTNQPFKPTWIVMFVAASI